MSPSTCITGAVICDPASGNLIADAHVILDGEKISNLAPPAGHDCGHPVDATGLFLLPGLIDCHDHLFNRRIQRTRAGMPIDQQRKLIFDKSDSYLAVAAAANAFDTLSRGVTTVRDLGCRAGIAMAVRDGVADGLIVGPTLLAAGQAITMTGGHFARHSAEADGPAAVAAAVRRQLSDGADCIKLMASGGLTGFPHEAPGQVQLNQDELRAGVIAAHNAGRRVAAHAQAADAIDNAVRAGVDSIEHGFLMRTGQAKLLAAEGVAFTPTLNTLRNTITAMRIAGDDELARRLSTDVLPAHEQAFRDAADAGVLIGAATDSTGPMAQELAIMVELGLSPVESLRTATVNAALICDLPDRGELRAGFAADIVAVTRNPFDDIHALDDLGWVMARGEIVRESMLGRQFS